MAKRVPQPPIDRAGRASEGRGIAVGVSVLIVAGVLLAAGFVVRYQAALTDGGKGVLPEYEVNARVIPGTVKSAAYAPLGTATSIPSSRPADDCPT